MLNLKTAYVLLNKLESSPYKGGDGSNIPILNRTVRDFRVVMTVLNFLTVLFIRSIQHENMAPKDSPLIDPMAVNTGPFLYLQLQLYIHG